MCGRYALALRPSQVRALLQDENMPVYDAPDDDGEGAPRQSYNFAPGYHGIVYRADVPDWGAGPAREYENGGRKVSAGKNAKTTKEAEETTEGARESQWQKMETTHYKLQSMKWGLVPFWTKRNPDYGAMLKTINCRDDSLATPGGMWATMKARKRCIVVAQGFYEWLKPSGSKSKDRIPYYIKRKDGKLLCLAGLWDCVAYDGNEEDGGGG